jgi:lincosamide nucleotidyltransferase A/C/D/E
LADVDAEDVVEVVAFLEGLGVEVWLDGGWGVDALLGRQTRPHGDLDVVVPLGDVTRVQAALLRRGYLLVRGGAPLSFKMADGGGRQVDVHSVSFNRSGEGLFEMENGDEWLCPAAGFEGVGEVFGRGVTCLSPDARVQRLWRSGYELDQVHIDDLTALSERFGTPVFAEK